MILYKPVEVAVTVAGSESQSLTGQTVELDREPDTIEMGVDGKMSVGHHLWTIIWHDKTADDLKAQFINVKITRSDGLILVNGPVNRNFEAPHNVPSGVRFHVE